MSYAQLAEYLAAQRVRRLPMTFREIERIIGRPLPASARQHRPWWANATRAANPAAQAWMRAGFRTADVDMAGERLVFRREDSPPGPLPSPPPSEVRETGAEWLARVHGSMRGTMTIAPGADLTEPTGAWSAEDA